MTIDVVSFDAGFTLVEPRVPVPDVYHREARALGAEVEYGSFARRVADCWKTLDRAYRSAHPDLVTSEEIERRQWALFTADVAAPFPELVERHEVWHRRLVEHFDRPDSWRLIDGALEILEGLRDRGFVLAVISNWHGALHEILAGLDVTDRFDLVLTSAEAGRKKPHAGIFHEACRRLGVQPCRVLHVGDSSADDLEGARAAGLEALLYDPGRRATNEERISALPDLLRRI